jgi:dTDP-4-dehydrorhamnose 3,5-epimerase
VFNPATEGGVNPLDPRVGLALPTGFEPIVSAKDAAAPTLEEAAAAGLLPTWETCLAFSRELAEQASR